MSPSWDTFIILFFVIMTVYGLLLGRGRVFSILINTFVGYVIAGELGDFAYNYLSRANSLSHSYQVSLFGAKVLLFATVIFVLTLNKELTGSNDDAVTSSFFTSAYGFLSAGLILSAVFSFMGESDRMNLFSASGLAAKVYYWHVGWLIAPVLLVAGTMFLRKVVNR
jgi:hypothetical protein